MTHQKYTSASTSRKQVSKIAKYLAKTIKDTKGKTILDFGGGKYDLTKNYLKDIVGLDVYIFDPYNRSKEDNEKALAQGKYDYVICDNVLNVVKEKEIRLDIVKQTLELAKNEVHIGIYTGDSSKIAKEDQKRNSFQLNQPIDFYISELSRYYNCKKIAQNILVICS